MLRVGGGFDLRPPLLLLLLRAAGAGLHNGELLVPRLPAVLVGHLGLLPPRPAADYKEFVNNNKQIFLSKLFPICILNIRICTEISVDDPINNTVSVTDCLYIYFISFTFLLCNMYPTIPE